MESKNFTDKSRVQSFIRKNRRGLDIDLLLESSVEVGGLDVEGRGGETRSSNDGKEESKSSKTSARGESLRVVNALYLTIAGSDSAGLVFLDGPVLIVLAIKNEVNGNSMLANGKGDRRTEHLLGIEGCYLVVASSTPFFTFRRTVSLRKGLGDRANAVMGTDGSETETTSMGRTIIVTSGGTRGSARGWVGGDLNRRQGTSGIVVLNGVVVVSGIDVGSVSDVNRVDVGVTESTIVVVEVVGADRVVAMMSSSVMRLMTESTE